MARKDYSAALEALSILTQGAATIHGQHVEDKMNEYNIHIKKCPKCGSEDLTTHKYERWTGMNFSVVTIKECLK